MATTMGIAPRSPETTGLQDFCDDLARQEAAGALSVDAVAQRFVRFFHLSANPGMEEIKALLEATGAKEVHEGKLSGLRGFHYALQGGDSAILYEEGQWQGGQEHSVLHEAFEIIYSEWQHRKSTLPQPPQQALCRAADRFAAAVLMQPDILRPFLYASGLDLVLLRHQFRRSYASVLYRARAVVGPALPFIGAWYERTTPGPPESWPWSVDAREFQVGQVARTSGFALARPNARFRPFQYPRHAMPRKGAPIQTGTAAHHVVQTSRPVLVERISGFDFWGYSDLTALARPVFWAGKLAKVLLLAVRFRDRGVLDPQVSALEPARKARAYQTV